MLQPVFGMRCIGAQPPSVSAGFTKIALAGFDLKRKKFTRASRASSGFNLRVDPEIARRLLPEGEAYVLKRSGSDMNAAPIRHVRIACHTCEVTRIQRSVVVLLPINDGTIEGTGSAVDDKIGMEPAR